MKRANICRGKGLHKTNSFVGVLAKMRGVMLQPSLCLGLPGSTASCMARWTKARRTNGRGRRIWRSSTRTAPGPRSQRAAKSASRCRPALAMAHRPAAGRRLGAVRPQERSPAAAARVALRRAAGGGRHQQHQRQLFLSVWLADLAPEPSLLRLFY